MGAHREKTENESIKRGAESACWLVDSQEFSQVAMSSRDGAVIAERSCNVFLNQWAASGEKQDEEKCGQS